MTISKSGKESSWETNIAGNFIWTSGSQKSMRNKFLSFKSPTLCILQVIVWCALTWFSHPRFTLSWLHSILAPWLKASKSFRAGMTEVWSCIFWSYFLGFSNKHAVYLQVYSNYILIRVSTYRNSVKRMVGWITILNCYTWINRRLNSVKDKNYQSSCKKT